MLCGACPQLLYHAVSQNHGLHHHAFLQPCVDQCNSAVVEVNVGQSQKRCAPLQNLRANATYLFISQVLTANCTRKSGFWLSTQV